MHAIELTRDELGEHFAYYHYLQGLTDGLRVAEQRHSDDADYQRGYAEGKEARETDIDFFA
jgi:hypothetical protein